ncbi:MAG: response regulator transcription factor [Myxococcota bacterium]|nr:response regulator transcription factor [Myxococcota bacterium]
MTLRILIVDDDARLFELLQSYLEPNGVVSVHAENGRRGLDALAASAFDAVLLDVMMPELDGLKTLQKIRDKSRVPVIMLTAKGDETDRVVGLEMGADDYLAKPFSPRELLARLRAVLRRTELATEKERLSVGQVSADLGSRRVSIGEREVDVTGLEFDLLVALMRRAGRVVPRAALLELAGRSDVNVNDRAVDVHISHLRKKLGDDPPRWIKTVRGVGYTMAKE